MSQYLKWVAEETKTQWWIDSANPSEIASAIADGCTGATTNPLLLAKAIAQSPEDYQDIINSLTAKKGDERAFELIGKIIPGLAALFLPRYEASGGACGYVCAQVNPMDLNDTAAMVAQAKRIGGMAPNLSVKLPCTAAGLLAMEECVKSGIHCTVTLSFTVAQAIAIERHYGKACVEAEAQGVVPGKCNAVLMVGRVYDHFRKKAEELKLEVTEQDMHLACALIIRKGYELSQAAGGKSYIMAAGFRDLAEMIYAPGYDCCISVQQSLVRETQSKYIPHKVLNDWANWADVILRMRKVPGFSEAFDIDGLTEDGFGNFEVVKQTCSDFVQKGWLFLSNESA